MRSSRWNIGGIVGATAIAVALAVSFELANVAGARTRSADCPDRVSVPSGMVGMVGLEGGEHAAEES